MGSVVQLTISGEDPSQRLQKTLAEGETVRVGRATKHGWEIPWDPKISREHAVLTWVEGQLRVQCLEQAKNPIIFRGYAVREARVGNNEWFQIGKTTFQVSHIVEEGGGQRGPDSQLVEFLADDGAKGEERAYSAAELQAGGFRNAERQMEILESLPEKISASQSDDDLGTVLSQLLLDAIPNAVAVAVAHFDDTELPLSVSDIDAFPKALFLRVQARKNYYGRFAPSRRLILKCLQTQECVMHIFEAAGESQFTMSEGLGWAFCSPIKTESTRGWCMYVSGRGVAHGGTMVREQDLVGDLRFTRLVSQFIGSIRQVRQLQEQRTQLSTFFSPKVIENLTTAKSMEVLSPAERDISVLFCNVRGFATKAEALGDDLMTLLQSVSAALGIMVSGIVERDGAIADFQGDAALGFWGWPTESPEGPVPACRTALAIHRAFQQGFSVTVNELPSLARRLATPLSSRGG
jgi:adenylate cyclase